MQGRLSASPLRAARFRERKGLIERDAESSYLSLDDFDADEARGHAGPLAVTAQRFLLNPDFREALPLIGRAVTGHVRLALAAG